MKYRSILKRYCKANGFELVEELNRFRRPISVHFSYRCPVCGERMSVCIINRYGNIMSSYCSETAKNHKKYSSLYAELLKGMLGCGAYCAHYCRVSHGLSYEGSFTEKRFFEVSNSVEGLLVQLDCMGF